MDESSLEDEAIKICLHSSLVEQLTDQRIVGRKNRAEMPVEPSIKQNKLLTQVVITANREWRCVCLLWQRHNRKLGTQHRSGINENGSPRFARPGPQAEATLREAMSG